MEYSLFLSLARDIGDIFEQFTCHEKIIQFLFTMMIFVTAIHHRFYSRICSEVHEVILCTEFIIPEILRKGFPFTLFMPLLKHFSGRLLLYCGIQVF